MMDREEAIAEVETWKKNPNNVKYNTFFEVVAALGLKCQTGKQLTNIQISAGDWRNGLTLYIEQKNKIEPEQIKNFVKWYENIH